MRVSIGSKIVEVRGFSEKEDLVRHLRTNPTFLLFESPEQEREFYSLSVRPNFVSAKANETTIGVCSEGQGLPPEMLAIPERQLLLIGFNDKVVVLDSESGRVVFEHKLRSLFWSFVRQQPSDVILVFYEIGVKLLDGGGRELWDYSSDLLKSATLEGNALTLNFADNPSVVLELGTGHIMH